MADIGCVCLYPYSW